MFSICKFVGMVLEPVLVLLSHYQAGLLLCFKYHQVALLRICKSFFGESLTLSCAQGLAAAVGSMHLSIGYEDLPACLLIRWAAGCTWRNRSIVFVSDIRQNLVYIFSFGNDTEIFGIVVGVDLLIDQNILVHSLLLCHEWPTIVWIAEMRKDGAW